jgi:hypothetical protein
MTADMKTLRDETRSVFISSSVCIDQAFSGAWLCGVVRRLRLGRAEEWNLIGTSR